MPDLSESAATRSYPLAQPIGASGLQHSSGYIREEYLRQLQGRRGRETYAEMQANDSTIGAVLFAITMLLRSVDWTVDPADDSAEAQGVAELVEGMLFKDMAVSWPEFVDSICSMFTYGFAVVEVLWKKRNGYDPVHPWKSSDFDDGLWGVHMLASRSQRTIDRWIFDPEEHLLGFEQMPFDRPQVVVPLSRCLLFRTTAELDNPEGTSVIRSAYRSWYFLKRLQEIEGVGIERDLAGYPVMRVPSALLEANANPAAAGARTAYEQMLKRIKRDEQEGLLLPSDRDENGNLYYDFELMSSGGSRQLAIDASIQRYQKDIARSVLADFIFLGADGGGSLALGRTKVQTFGLAMQGYLNHIASVVNESLVPKLLTLNGYDPKFRPRTVPGSIEPEDLEALSAYLQMLSTVGYDLASDERLENLLRAKADLPEAPERDDEDFAPEPDEEDLPVAARRALPAPKVTVTVNGGEAEETEAVAKRLTDWVAFMEGFDGR